MPGAVKGVGPTVKSPGVKGDPERPESDQEDEEGPGVKAPATGWNTQAFSTLPPPPPRVVSTATTPGRADADAAYGTFRLPKLTADGVFSDRISDNLVSYILAFLISCSVVFCLEAEDKSEAAFVLPGRRPEGPTIAFGFLLGLVPALLIAVLLGFVLERQLSDQRLTFAVTGIFMALSLVSLSQALLHLAPAVLVLPPSNSTVTSLLMMAAQRILPVASTAIALGSS